MVSKFVSIVPLIPPTPSPRLETPSVSQKKGVNPLLSLLAGSVAGGVEATITYPFEFTKTHSQLRSKTPGQPQRILLLVKDVVKTEGLGGLYTGCSTLVVGTAFKAGVRFLSFDLIKNALVNEDGKLSTSRGILAGMMAGAVESVLAVTPTERIKTALIDDAKSNKTYHSNLHCAKSLIHNGGLANLYKGLASTTMKQSATSAVRMGSYNFLRTLSTTHSIKQTPLSIFAMGSIAGIVTVYATQPFDSIKTRAQSAKGMSTMEAGKSVWRDGGVKGFWKGSTMRLGRLVLSGGIVFSVYEEVLGVFGR